MLDGDFQAVGIGAGAGGILMWLASQLPKWFATLKRDKLDGEFAATQMVMVDGINESYAKRFQTQQEWQDKTDAKLAEMDSLIHRQQVKVTRLTVVMLRLEAKIKILGADIEPDLIAEMEDLRGHP
jgi:hypothetical protein